MRCPVRSAGVVYVRAREIRQVGRAVGDRQARVGSLDIERAAAREAGIEESAVGRRRRDERVAPRRRHRLGRRKGDINGHRVGAAVVVELAWYVVVDQKELAGCSRRDRRGTPDQEPRGRRGRRLGGRDDASYQRTHGHSREDRVRVGVVRIAVGVSGTRASDAARDRQDTARPRLALHLAGRRRTQRQRPGACSTCRSARCEGTRSSKALGTRWSGPNGSGVTAIVRAVDPAPA